MHEVRSAAGRKAIAACVLLAVPVLYVPFRLIAQKFNTATTAGIDAAGNIYPVDNFAYPFAILIWPTFAVLCGFVTSYVAKRFGRAWPVVLGVMIAAFFLTYLTPRMDELLGIPGGGLDGFVSWPSNRAGITTPKLSAILCLALFWAAAIVGAVIGAAHTSKKSENA